MIVLDENGKLFGKINLFDFVVIVLICILLVFGISKIVQRYFVKKSFDQYVIKLKAPNLEELVANSIKKGNLIVTPTGSKFGEIITDPVIKQTEVYAVTSEGIIVPRTQPKLKDVYFSILVSVPEGAKTINYGNQTFKVGASGFIETYFGKYPISILSIEKYNPTKETTETP
jgi:hypothetical protein